MRSAGGMRRVGVATAVFAVLWAAPMTIASPGVHGAAPGLDTTFNSSGTEPGIQRIQLPVSIGEGGGTLLPDGGVVFWATATTFTGSIVGRLTSAGVLDQTFNSTGTPSGILDVTPVALRDDLIVQSTGKLVGVARDYLLRLDQNGVADSTFGFWPGVPPIHPPGTAFIVAPPLRVAEISNHIFTVGPLDSTTFNAGSDLGTNMLSLDGVLDGSYGATGPVPGSMRFTIPGSSVGGSCDCLLTGRAE